MLYPKDRCPIHPNCKAWVLVKNRAICFDCWNNDNRPTNIKEKEIENDNHTRIQGNQTSTHI